MEQFAWYLGVQNKLMSAYTTIARATSQKLIKAFPTFTKDLQDHYHSWSQSCAAHSLGTPKENYSVMCLYHFNHLTFTQFCTTISITFDKIENVLAN